MPVDVSGIGGRRHRRKGPKTVPATALLLASSLVLMQASAALAQAAAETAAPHATGIAVQSGVEFGGRCLMALAQGQIVETTCKVTWQGPDAKTYCFLSEDARTEFLKNPEQNLAKAREFYVASASKVAPTRAFTEEDAEAAATRIIEERSKDGVFLFDDPRTGEALRLKFQKFGIIRGMAGYGWFPNAVFHVEGIEKKQYAIDFWLVPDGEQLRLMDIRIHKAPVADGASFYMKTRSPVAWWWLPVSEHPGDPEVTRAWHVMSAIHRHVARSRKDGVYHLTDEKTGQAVPLEFVEIHMPVRRLKEDGRYFACTDFRKSGSKTEFYDVDFWLDRKTGEIEVGSVRIHKVPVQDQENGLWYQEKRYDFRGLNFDVVN
jgi:hypothetical protein